MFEEIKMCSKCALCKHQPPLIDSTVKCQVFWVGLSAKLLSDMNERPLSPSTNSGAILTKIEEGCGDLKAYRTNLVKCVPLNAQGKIRYPNKTEINYCISHLDLELRNLSPKIIFLLGSQVTEAIGKRYGISFQKWSGFNYTFERYKDYYFIPIHHPSYVHVYKRKQVSEYISSIENIINQLL